MSDIDLFIRQENEVLKKEKHELQHKIIDLRQSKEELQQRIDKAIELIKRSAGYKGICTQPETDTFSKLLEILGDKENEKDI